MPDDEEKKAAARSLSVKEGATYSVMDGFGLRAITPFALQIGASNAQIGLLTSIPAIIGNVSQLWTAKAMERASRKRLVAWGVFLQALMWLPILGLGVLHFVFEVRDFLPTTFIVLYTLLALFGAFVGPVWMSWMSDLVTSNGGSYFGRRNRICGIVALLSMLLGGLLLDTFKTAGHILIGFAVLFGVSFLARSFGAYLFTRKYEPQFQHTDDYYFSFRQFVAQMRHNNFGRFAIFDAFVSFAVAIGSPFVAVYMLRELQFSYTVFTIVGLGSVTTTLLFMPAWGKFADRYGNLTTMRITGLLVPVVMALWAASPLVKAYAPALLVPYLVLTDAFSGLAWSGFNLSTTNFLYDAVTKQRVALCAAYTNILNGAGTFLGAAIGGLVASLVMPYGLSALIGVFIVSGVVRFLGWLMLMAFVREVRPVQPFDIKTARQKLIALSPGKVFDYLDLRLR